MITIKHDLPGRNMTFAQRRRLLNLLWAFVSNASIPFLLGFILAVVSVTYTVEQAFLAIDKSGLGYCVQLDLKETESHNINYFERGPNV